MIYYVRGSEMRKRIGLMVLFLMLLFIGIAIQSNRVNATEPALLKVVNPLTGDEWFNFTTNNKSMGDTFLVNITLFNVTGLATIQVMLTWDPTILSYSNFNVPPNAIFPPPQFSGARADVSVPGHLVYGYGIGPGQTSFSGDGIFFQIEFKIIAYGKTLLHLDSYPSNDTYLLDNNLHEMPFTTVDGHFSFTTALKGDLNGDSKVDMRDVYMVVNAFNSFPNTPRWNALADLDGNGHVDIRDILMVILNFSRTS
jgi:hypothetical protein